MYKSIVFSVLFGISAFAFGQNPVGEHVSNGSVKQVAIAAYKGAVYVAYAEEGEERQIHLKKFDGKAWVELAPLPAAAKTGDKITLAINNDMPFILFSNGDGMTLAKLDNGQWKTEGKAGFAADISTYDPKLCFVNGVAHIVYENKTDDKIDMHMLVKNGNAHIWSAMDAIDQVPGGAESPSITVDAAGQVYLAWFDRKNDKVGITKVKGDGAQLEDISKGIPGKDASAFLGVWAVGNKLLMAYEDKKNGYFVQLMQYNTEKSRWEAMANGREMQSESFDLVQNYAVAYLDAEKRAAVQTKSGSGWSEAKLFSASESYCIAICAEGNTTYIAFSDPKKGHKISVVKL